MTTNSLNEEQIRILRAALDGRLDTNEHGRWVIRGEARPARKDRERLLHGGLITWPHRETRQTITEAGVLALEAA